MTEVCAMCYRPAECQHHLIFGNSQRKLAEEDGLKLPLCNDCHNMAEDAKKRIHGNMAAEKLSKMLGQALWERWYLGDYGDAEETLKTAREEFKNRYGRSYL